MRNERENQNEERTKYKRRARTEEINKKALEFGLISAEQAIELGYKPKKRKPLQKKQKRKKRFKKDI